MKFNSQICTSREQSERLLAMGLKKETSDMYYRTNWINAVAANDVIDLFEDDVLPAWSLHRLIEMMPDYITPKEGLPSFSGFAYLNLAKTVVWYNYTDYDAEDRAFIHWCGNGIFSAIVDAIEWLIKEGYFNKEYLVK